MRGEARILPSSAKRRVCWLHLLNLYLQIGETLPNHFNGKKHVRKLKRYKVFTTGSAEENSHSSGDDMAPDCTHGHNRLEQELEVVRQEVLADTSLFQKFISTGLGSNLEGLPLRYLPPGTVRDLWLDLAATGADVSYPTFKKAWDVFTCLRFRQPGDFVQCDTCVQLKTQLREALKLRSLVLLVCVCVCLCLPLPRQ